MIKIKVFQKKWRIEIIDEEWEFETREKMDEALKELLNFKGEYGDVK